MISNIFKFILGFLLAITILASGGFAAALYFMNRASIPPAKPIFANDKASVKAQAQATPTPGDEPDPNQSKTPTPTTKQVNEDSQDEESLPPGAYSASVTWPQGLSLRSEPGLDSERIGGVAFQQKVIVLQERNQWQKVRLEGSEQVGWVKAGNTKKVEE